MCWGLCATASRGLTHVRSFDPRDGARARNQRAFPMSTVLASAYARRHESRLAIRAARFMRVPAMNGPFDLERFVAAQDQGGTYDAAVAELRAGRKRSHWMWFVFPQIAGLGQSPISRRYAISSLAEAE